MTVELNKFTRDELVKWDTETHGDAVADQIAAFGEGPFRVVEVDETHVTLFVKVGIRKFPKIWLKPVKAESKSSADSGR